MVSKVYLAETPFWNSGDLNQILAQTWRSRTNFRYRIQSDLVIMHKSWNTVLLAMDDLYDISIIFTIYWSASLFLYTYNDSASLELD